MGNGDAGIQTFREMIRVEIAILEENRINFHDFNVRLGKRQAKVMVAMLFREIGLWDIYIYIYIYIFREFWL